MKKVFNALAIFANIAIVIGLVKDTCDRLATKREKTVTDLENDEVWENRRVGYRTTRRDSFHLEGYKEIPGDAEEKDQ